MSSELPPNNEPPPTIVEPYRGAGQPLPMPDEAWMEAKDEPPLDTSIYTGGYFPVLNSGGRLAVVAVIALICGLLSFYGWGRMPSCWEAYPCPQPQAWQWLLYILALPGLILVAFVIFKRRFLPRSRIAVVLIGLVVGFAFIINLFMTVVLIGGWMTSPLIRY